MRISQAQVNDPAHRWRGGVDAAQSIFALLAQAPLDLVHIAEPEASRPAFEDAEPSLLKCARSAAPRLRIIANGGLHAPQRALQALVDGADMVALGRGALANPDWPARVAEDVPLRDFDGSMLTPLANIKVKEIERAPQRLDNCA